ncbi:MAG: hypothetical protein AAF639_45735 [Chloroflexota bacterium]
MRKEIQCLFCESTDVELMSLYGQTLLGSQYYCRECKSIFEVIRFDDDDDNVDDEEEETDAV